MEIAHMDDESDPDYLCLADLPTLGLVGKG